MAVDNASTAKKLPHHDGQLVGDLSQVRDADALSRRACPGPCDHPGGSQSGVPSASGELGAPVALATLPPREPAFTGGVSRPLVGWCRLFGETEGITCIVLDP